MLPLAELGSGFYDQLKSISSGYANFDYEEGESRTADLVRLDLLVNGAPVDALARVVHRCPALPHTTPSHCFRIYNVFFLVMTCAWLLLCNLKAL